MAHVPTTRIGLVVASGLLLAACEPTEGRGVFAPAAKTEAPAAAAAPDPAFDFPADPPLVLSSEQMAGGDLPSGLAAAAGVDPNKLPDAAPAEPAAAAPAAPPPTGLPAIVQWPVRLVSTIPQAQPPRAILGLASGEERVVSPGSILADEGLVVMSVSADKVQLARIEPAGDHARIDSVELTAQYK